MTPTETHKLLLMLSQVWPTPLTAERARAWHLAAGHWDYALAESVALELLATATFEPRPSDLNRRCAELIHAAKLPSPLDAWSAIVQLDYRRAGELDRLPPLVREVFTGITTLRDFALSPTPGAIQRTFLEAYEAARARELEVLMLPPHLAQMRASALNAPVLAALPESPHEDLGYATPEARSEEGLRMLRDLRERLEREATAAEEERLREKAATAVQKKAAAKALLAEEQKQEAPEGGCT